MLCYGDSLTVGFCKNGAHFQPYGEMLKEVMAAAGTECEVTYMGLCGCTSGQMVGWLDSPVCMDLGGRQGKGLARMLDDEGRPDLVIIMAGTNDLGSGVPPDALLANLRRLHGACHARGVPTVALAPPYPPQWPGPRAARGAATKRLSAWSLANSDVLACVDPEDLVPRSTGLWEQHDGLHLTAAGSGALGKQLAPMVLSLLAQLRQEAAHLRSGPLGGA